MGDEIESSQESDAQGLTCLWLNSTHFLKDKQQIGKIKFLFWEVSTENHFIAFLAHFPSPGTQSIIASAVFLHAFATHAYVIFILVCLYYPLAESESQGEVSFLKCKKTYRELLITPRCASLDAAEVWFIKW